MVRLISNPEKGPKKDLNQGLLVRSRVFLTAEWRHLVMLNYEIDAEILKPRVPVGTELDLFNGKAFVSVVGFMFLKTAVFGIPVPLHQQFEEVNLRFYVRRRVGDNLRRGVVFIREFAPSWAVVKVARAIYNENYSAVPMKHRIDLENGNFEYAWRTGSHWNRLSVCCDGSLQMPRPGSEEEFVVEHYWGYTPRADGGCTEYAVEHKPWRICSVRDARLESDVAGLYGPEFVLALGNAPHSALVADGSAVSVFTGVAIPRHHQREEVAYAR